MQVSFMLESMHRRSFADLSQVVSNSAATRNILSSSGFCQGHHPYLLGYDAYRDG